LGVATAKGDILNRIRSALGAREGDRLAEYRAIPRRYRRSGTLGADARIELFISRIQHYDGGIFRCDRDALADTIAAALSERSKRRLIVPPALPREWLPAGFHFVADENLEYPDLDGSEGALTTCTVAIAFTGTMVLSHSPREGRRALTLVPDYHLCVVEGEQIVETVPQAFDRLREVKPSLVTTISGPSATADIEMTRIKGVHGPRTLDVIVVE
jgi:L-lactate dehydrogenase complex protein LldG